MNTTIFCFANMYRMYSRSVGEVQIPVRHGRRYNRTIHNRPTPTLWSVLEHNHFLFYKHFGHI